MKIFIKKNLLDQHSHWPESCYLTRTPSPSNFWYPPTSTSPAKKAIFKTSQDIATSPVASKCWQKLFHQYSAFFEGIWVAKGTFSQLGMPSHRRSSQSLTPKLAYLKIKPFSKGRGLFLWKRFNPWYSAAPPPPTWFSTTFAKAYRALAIMWLFIPAITPYTNEGFNESELEEWKQTTQGNISSKPINS